MRRRAALLALLLAGPALAQTQWTPPAEIRKSAPKDATPVEAAPKAERKPVAAYGDDHPDCAEWTDGCIVCLREADGPACSMPGIACLPAEEPDCRRQAPL